MQQSFEHGEVATAQRQLSDALFGVRLNCARRLPQHQEDVNATSPRQRFRLVFAHCSYIYIYRCLDIKILHGKADVNRGGGLVWTGT